MKHKHAACEILVHILSGQLRQYESCNRILFHPTALKFCSSYGNGIIYMIIK